MNSVRSIVTRIWLVPIIWLCSSLREPTDSLDPFSDERCKPYLNTVAARYASVHDDFERGLALARTIEDAWTRDSAFVSIGMAWVGAKDFESVIALVPEIADAGRKGPSPPARCRRAGEG